jgi:hypothetical protein
MWCFAEGFGEDEGEERGVLVVNCANLGRP